MKDCRFVWLLWSVCHGHVCCWLYTFLWVSRKKEVKVSLEGFRFFLSFSLRLLWKIAGRRRIAVEELAEKGRKLERILTCVLCSSFQAFHIHVYCVIWYDSTHVLVSRLWGDECFWMLVHNLQLYLENGTVKILCLFLKTRNWRELIFFILFTLFSGMEQNVDEHRLFPKQVNTRVYFRRKFLASQQVSFYQIRKTLKKGWN